MADSLEDVMSGVQDRTFAVPIRPANVLVVKWSRKGIGWGEVAIHVNEDRTVLIDDETMGREFVKEVLSALVDGATLVSDKSKP